MNEIGGKTIQDDIQKAYCTRVTPFGRYGIELWSPGIVLPPRAATMAQLYVRIKDTRAEYTSCVDGQTVPVIIPKLIKLILTDDAGRVSTKNIVPTESGSYNISVSIAHSSTKVLRSSGYFVSPAVAARIGLESTYVGIDYQFENNSNNSPYLEVVTEVRYLNNYQIQCEPHYIRTVTEDNSATWINPTSCHDHVVVADSKCCEFFDKTYMGWNEKAEDECTYFFKDTPMLF